MRICMDPYIKVITTILEESVFFNYNVMVLFLVFHRSVKRKENVWKCSEFNFKSHLCVILFCMVSFEINIHKILLSTSQHNFMNWVHWHNKIAESQFCKDTPFIWSQNAGWRNYHHPLVLDLYPRSWVSLLSQQPSYGMVTNYNF